ncbi:phosphodiester glycosidase family protein [Gemmobacter denitrificans]|uniref:Phosphodiester glycosidase family protein n=1 Tax=Gemmobacter denitrificans TaxID=3123040 RepID=A0ABU8C006_9RHOB
MRRNLLAALAFLAGSAFAGAALAAPCTQTRFEDAAFTLCEVAAGQDLRLFHSDAAGDLLGSFGAVEDFLAAENRQLVFAMNAGMYHPDRSPVGLYVDQAGERAPIVTGASDGNFGMLPNAVFCIGTDGFSITDSRDFAARPRACRFATQSGPMLVRKGALHPRFIPGGDSRYIRNGVGVSADGRRAVFVISEDAVNFDTFGRLFRDALALPDALYFDGKVSRLYAPALGRSDLGLPMGPIVGLVAERP